jgi:hypothetical protein
MASRRISIGGKKYTIVYEYQVYSGTQSLGTYAKEQVAVDLAKKMHALTGKPTSVTRVAKA